MTPASMRREATWNERAATTAIFLVLGIGFGAWAAALPSIRANLALSDRDVSMALLTLSLGSVAATLAAGWIAPRFGTGRVTGVAAVAFCLAAALPTWASSLPGLIGLAVLFGLANGLLDISMNGHATDVERRWGLAIMSSFHGAFSLGGLAGATLGGLLIGAGLTPAGETAAIAGLNATLVLMALPALGRGAQSEPDEAGLAWPNRAAWTLSIIAFCCLLIEGAMADWSGIYLATIAHASDALAASGYAAFSVTMTFGRFAGDQAIRRFGPRAIVIGGCAVSALGLLLSVAHPSLAASSLGFLLVGLGLSNVVPAVFSAAGRFGRTPAAGIAAVASVGYAGFVSGPPLIGAIATATDLRLALGVVVLVAIVAVLCGFLVRWDAGRSG